MRIPSFSVNLRLLKNILRSYSLDFYYVIFDTSKRIYVINIQNKNNNKTP